MSWDDFKIIFRDVGNLLLMVSLLALISMVVPMVFKEYSSLYPLLVTSILSCIVGMSLKFIGRTKSEMQLTHAMAVSSIAWLVIPLFGSIPYILIEGMSPLNSLFESTSGWTGTGLSMIPAPSQLTHTIQFWRSLTQWIGGVGVIVLIISIITRPGTSMYHLYRAEGREEKIFPRIMTTVRMIWWIYFVLTAFSIIILLLVKMPLWDSINHGMTAISTGGFSVKDSSIASYDDPLIESALIPIMILGAIPFLIHYKVLKGDLGAFLKDVQIRSLLFLLFLACSLLVVENSISYNWWSESLRYSVFQTVSGLTCTGLQTATIHTWAPNAKLIVIVLMLLGGAAGSTAGGIKLVRGAALFSGIGWWYKKISLPHEAIVVQKFGDKVLSDEEMGAQLNEAALISFLWLIFLFTGIFVMLHITPLSYHVDDVIFEVVSAQSNVGLSTGITSPDMMWAGKLMLIFNMWIGRLEIIPIIVTLKFLLQRFT
ncbi:MAG: TrkH family potassium uptake protein [ANME-2 cluster archaeon]|nr:TrkH family potassium uptake protein [ANME-2 cluster archaeon]